MRTTRRAAARFVTIAVTSLFLVGVTGQGAALAAYDSPSCGVNTIRFGPDSCETTSIIPHDSQLWVRVRLTPCGGQMKARIWNNNTGQYVGDTYWAEGGWRPDPWEPGKYIPTCITSAWTAYGMTYRHYYSLRVEAVTSVMGRGWICNYTYDPRDGRTC